MSNEQKVKVLCVEDEREILDTMCEILRDEGFEVFEATNGKLGFESFLHNKPDVIVSDIMMPELDGYGLLKMVRESKDKRSALPFIFLSALGQKENILKGANLSANDYLVKPIDFDILIAKITEKTINAGKVQEIHNSNIENIKSQISSALPSEIFSYLDSMTQMLKMLKDEPYGPFPHRRYLEDINKIYFDSVKLKAAITNALDHEVIDSKLNANEEIFTLNDFLDQAIANLPDKIKSRVEFEHSYDNEIVKIKIDKALLIEVVKKVIAGVIKLGAESSLRIAVMSDPLNQILIVFFIKTDLSIVDVELSIDADKIKSICEMQGCYYKISKNENSKDIAAIFSVPNHRVIR